MHIQVRINVVFWVRSWVGVGVSNPIWIMKMRQVTAQVGYGQSYQPWLRAQDVKSRGNRSIVFGLKTFRNHHLLSSVESNFFYLAQFNDSVIDIREQFPLFPLQLTQQIANHLHFQHPMVRGVRGVPVEVLNVMTTDFLLTLRTPEGGLRYKAIAVKHNEHT